MGMLLIFINTTYEICVHIKFCIKVIQHYFYYKKCVKQHKNWYTIINY